MKYLMKQGNHHLVNHHHHLGNQDHQNQGVHQFFWGKHVVYHQKDPEMGMDQEADGHSKVGGKVGTVAHVWVYQGQPGVIQGDYLDVISVSKQHWKPPKSSVERQPYGIYQPGYVWAQWCDKKTQLLDQLWYPGDPVTWDSKMSSWCKEGHQGAV